MITKVEYIENYILKVFFYDKLVRIIDLHDFFSTSTQPQTHKFFDLDLFKQVRVENGTITWGENECDINPVSIYNGEFDAVTIPKSKSKQKLDKQLV